ncbi:alkyl sulfatase C-terminal domain-containing protein, partial [Paraburkholderia sp. SIMBA_055]
LELRIDWQFTDTGKRFALNLQHGALSSWPGVHRQAPHVTLTMTRATLDRILMGETGFGDAIRQAEIQVAGEQQFLAMLAT